MSKTPNIRFNGFSDNWKEKQLSEIFVIKNNKNKNQYSREGVLSVSDYEGCVNQIKFHGRSFAGKDISNYKIADIGDIIYTKSPLQSKPYGIVKIVTEEAGIVSPLYVVNAPTKENDSLFMYYLFDSPERTNKYLEPLVRKGAKNTMNISDAEWLSGNVVVSENLEEQQKIGLLFKKIDDLINVETSKIDELSKIKQALLLKMFPANNEDVPSIRFKDFTNDWEQRELSECSEITTGGTPNTQVEKYWNPKEIPWMSSGEIHKKYILFTDNMISKEGLNNSSARYVPEKSVLMAIAGQGKTRATVAINLIPITTNQSVAAIILNNTMIPEFILYNLESRYEELRQISAGDGSRGGLNKHLVSEIIAPYTKKEEQNKIGLLFNTLDNLITLHQRKPFHLNFSL